MKTNITNNSIPEIHDNDLILTDNFMKANDFFTRIGKQINKNVIPSSILPDYYLRDLPEPPMLDLGNVGPIYMFQTSLKAFF